MRFNPLSWFAANTSNHRVWLIALTIAVAIEVFLFYSAISCGQPSDGLAGLGCILFLFPALPIILLLGELVLHAASVSTLPPTVMFGGELLTFIGNVLCIALVLNGILRFGAFIVRALTSDALEQ